MVSVSLRASYACGIYSIYYVRELRSIQGGGVIYHPSLQHHLWSVRGFLAYVVIGSRIIMCFNAAMRVATIIIGYFYAVPGEYGYAHHALGEYHLRVDLM